MIRKTLFLFALPTCILVVFGCGPSGPDYGSLDLSEVHGTITLDGQPLSGAIVHFESEDETFSDATSDANGRYEMMFNSEQPGVLKGRKIVRIWSSRKSAGESEGGEEEEGDPDSRQFRVEMVPAQYNVKSTLTTTVEKDAEEFNFDLKSR